MGLEISEVTFAPRVDGSYEPRRPSVLQGIALDEISQPDYIARLDQINETYQKLKHPITGEGIEVAVVNPEKLNENLILFPSTHFSSLTQNIGNAIELAARGAGRPNAAIAYVAYPGNG